MKTLHEAIKHNDIKLFIQLISSPEVDVNEQDNEGRTPLLYCLKLQRPDLFICYLFDAKCDVTLGDRNRTTPLSIALTDRRVTIARWLMAMGADLAQDLKISNKYLRDAIQTRCWDFVWFLLRYFPNLVYFFLCDLQSREVEPDSDYALFALLAELDKYLSDDPDKKRYNGVGMDLVQYSLGLRDSNIFKLVWPRINHQCIVYWAPTFLRMFLNSCIFPADEFIICLGMIMASPDVSSFFNFYKNKNINQSFHFDLIIAYVWRTGEVDSIRFYMHMCLCFISVDIVDILAVYGAFGIGQETLFLVEHFQRQSLTNNEYHQKLALEFLKHLENDDRLEGWALKILESIAKKPSNKQVSSLFELSTGASQRLLQNSYKIKNPDEFQQTVECLCLPRIIKKRLCCNCNNNAVQLAAPEPQTPLLYYILAKIPGRTKKQLAQQSFSDWDFLKKKLKNLYQDKKHYSQIMEELDNCR
ncbi:hypothetical protein ILUMI_18463 [Ignelater luminosus]|uniref:Uncharacterized protein n=1 Tax=Ignelater luminosus TaxID=2038154 RepID=A0A8K0CQ43_IGNLU|nr:hypothetical protein ILUMI_18463 [Ignelater luminosus]